MILLWIWWQYTLEEFLCKKKERKICLFHFRTSHRVYNLSPGPNQILVTPAQALAPAILWPQSFYIAMPIFSVERKCLYVWGCIGLANINCQSLKNIIDKKMPLLECDIFNTDYLPCPALLCSSTPFKALTHNHSKLRCNKEIPSMLSKTVVSGLQS